MNAILDALALAGSMTWEVLWALILGFALSAVVQAVVRKSTVVNLLGDDHARTLTVSAGLGAASSSCSYAAVALARSLFRKGANFTAAMTFEIASTNLVVELGILLALLMGWQFTIAEFVGGPLMIVFVALMFRFFVRERLLRAAREQAEKGLAGSMEGHAAMDMSVARAGTFWQRLGSREGFTSVSHVFVMEWAAILRDLVIGLLIAGAIGAWVPESFWRGFFLTDHRLGSALWGPVVGPVVAILSFVCSIGNVPLAAVLWNGGISFGGVVAFIFADLLILPILNIYRKYYGVRMALTLLGVFYLAMVAAGYVVELLFGVSGLIPTERNARIEEAGISWNYTTWLNIAFLLLAAVLLFRFFRTGGRAMLSMMGGAPTGTS
ncbi:permease [Amycolatopsis pithecellobii]|uniref:Permease n=1 Tax=Amycolatopsis pithecellobii TaxID=664692 RepID=A0A6N7Z9Q7_9PSEU|nr:permease [Amycolatopsis pithecellobii]MTD58464.1 permease [Amycolatopsis pithecellobii]